MTYQEANARREAYEAAYKAACDNRAAVDRAERCPNEANLNGAHNLFYSIAMTGKA